MLVYIPHGNYIRFGYTGAEAWELGQRVIAYARTNFPDIHVYVGGCIPTASRRENSPQFLTDTPIFEERQREFVRSTPGCTFIDFRKYPALAKDENFVENGVHFNATGYGVFAEVFKDVLKDELERF